MPIPVQCASGHRFTLPDDSAGKQVKCPECDRPVFVERRAPAIPVDPAFDRDKFLLKQQVLTVQQRYEIADETGKLVVFAERPYHHLRGFLSIGVFLLTGLVVLFALAVVHGLIFEVSNSTAANVSFLVALVLAFVAASVAAIAVSAKRHVTFYRDPTKKERLLEILQDAKFQPITMTFTVRDAQGKVLALIRKNIFTNILRKRWWCVSPDGKRTLFVAKEDSVLLSLLRRLLGPFFGLLRAQFIFTRGTSDSVFGEFNRKFTLLDKYVVDLSRDNRRQFDRRLALAMGIMLDSGERR
jgi:uncharacterized protein YxjI